MRGSPSLHYTFCVVSVLCSDRTCIRQARSVLRCRKTSPSRRKGNLCKKSMLGTKTSFKTPDAQTCRRSTSQGPRSTLVFITNLGQKSLLFRSLLQYYPQKRTQHLRHDTFQSWPLFSLTSCPCPARHLGVYSRICPLYQGFA
jgi:hypothetical protein